MHLAPHSATRQCKPLLIDPSAVWLKFLPPLQLVAQTNGGGSSAWADEYNSTDNNVYREWESIYGHGAVHDAATASAGRDYAMSADNAFVGDPQAFAKGKALFK